jgi:hypothetical protein
MLLNENYPEINCYSANDVPFPLDEYLRLTGKPTTSDIAKVLLKWKPRYKKTSNPAENLEEKK